MTIDDRITPESTLQYIKQDPKGFVKILHESILPEMKSLMTVLNETNECKEFEMCLMDIDSMIDHVNTYMEKGPSAPFVKVPLEDSEIAADAPENSFGDYGPIDPAGNSVHLVGE